MRTEVTFSAALFDVDGTLIDSNDAHARSWTEALAANGARVRQTDVRRLIGAGGDKLLAAIAGIDEASALGKAIVARKKATFASLLPSLRPTSGARQLLEYLAQQHVRLVVATSADSREMTALLHQAGVDDLLPLRVSKDDAARSKPDPDILQAAIQRSGVAIEEAVMIGDTPYDVTAALRAGVRAIALRCGGTWSDRDFVGAALIADDPAALLSHLADHWSAERQDIAEPVPVSRLP